MKNLTEFESAILSLPEVVEVIAKQEAGKRAEAISLRSALIDKVIEAEKNISVLENEFSSAETKTKNALAIYEEAKSQLFDANQALSACRSIWQNNHQMLVVSGGNRSVIDGLTKLTCWQQHLDDLKRIAEYRVADVHRIGMLTHKKFPRASQELAEIEARIEVAAPIRAALESLLLSKEHPDELASEVSRLLSASIDIDWTPFNSESIRPNYPIPARA